MKNITHSLIEISNRHGVPCQSGLVNEGCVTFVLSDRFRAQPNKSISEGNGQTVEFLPMVREVLKEHNATSAFFRDVTGGQFLLNLG